MTHTMKVSIVPFSTEITLSSLIDTLKPAKIDDMVKMGFPRPNFKPFSLTAAWLGFFIVWSFLCFAGVMVLVVLGDKQPPTLHFHSNTSYEAWVYVPSIIAALTTTFVRTIFFSYLRFIPFISMANVPDKYPTTNSKNFVEMAKQLNLTAAGYPGLDFRGRLILAFAASFVANLAPLKSGFLQPLQDTAGWKIEVSSGIGIMVAIIYLISFCSILTLFVRVRTSSTGLKWSPCSLAAQLALVQGSNIFPAFSRLDLHRKRHFKDELRSMGERYGVLRLGYWRKENPPSYYYGIRFVSAENSKTIQDLKTLNASTSSYKPIPQTPRTSKPPAASGEDPSQGETTQTMKQ
jgi:hypothetical protein